MKNIRIIFLVICLSVYGLAVSQQIQIKSVDESEFPLIKVTLDLSNSKNINFNSLYIIENKDTTNYSIDSILNLQQEKAICFLIDQDLSIESTKNDIVAAIKDVAQKMGKGDFIDVILCTEKKADGKCIYPLSFEFSNESESFIDFLDIYFSSAKFSSSPKIIDCSIGQTLEFIKSKKNIPPYSFLAIISKIPYAGGQDWENIRKKADDYGILYQWFSFISKEQFYSTYNQNIQDIIKNKLDSLNNGSNILKNKTYTLSFITKQNEKLNQFEINYHNEKARSTFERSGYFNFFKDNTLIISIIGFFFILILSFIANLLYTRHQLSKSLKELQKNQQLMTEAGNTQKIEVNETSKTQYENSFVAPSVKVEIGGITSIFELKKIMTKIGRLKENDIVIEDLTISSTHATLTKEGGRFYLQDNESTNGTFVNDIKIGKTVIKNGDSIRMGKAVLTITY